jgi:glucokinase
MVVSSGGPICSCGKPGHLEAYAAAPSIVGRFRERLLESDSSKIESWPGPNISVKAIFEAAHRHEPIATDIVSETVQVLGIAVANLITVLNPTVVIIGGSVSDVGTLLMEPLGARVRQYSYPASVRRVRLTASQLGADSTVLGAVALALTSLKT